MHDKVFASLLMVMCGCSGSIDDDSFVVDDDADTQAALSRTLEHGIMGAIKADEGLPPPSYGANLAARAGAKWVRTQLPWCGLEWNAPQNGVHQYTWNNKGYEDELRAAKAAGLKVMGTLLCVPPWAHCENWGQGRCQPNKDQARKPPSEAQYLYEFARDAAAHYAGLIDAFDVWNEPGLETWFYMGTPSQFRHKILKPAFDGWKAGNPKALVVGVSNFTNEKRGIDITGWTHEKGQLVVPLDRFTLHTYGDIGTIKMRMAQFNDWCKRRPGKCGGFWVTEGGFDSNADPHGKKAVAMLQQCNRLSKCERVFLFHMYNLQSGTWTNGYENYGFAKRDGTIKPRYCGLQKFLVGAALEECGGAAPAAALANEVFYGDNTPVAEQAEPVLAD